MRLLGVAATLAACVSGPAVQSPDTVRVPIADHGLSAIEVHTGGTRFTALSDRGVMLSGRLARRGGRLIGVRVDRRQPLEIQSMPGAPAEAVAFDSEGLALLPDGTMMVAFEGQHRLVAYGPDGILRDVTPFPEPEQRLHVNRGVEALAALPDGSIIAIPETPVGGVFPVWRLPPGGAPWQQIATLPADTRSRPVGADLGPDGRIYVLERAFTGVGFAARIGSMDAGGADFRIEKVFPFGQHGNLEGLSVWCTAAGHIRATMVEDDNGLALQRGAVVELQLSVDTCGVAG